VDHTDETSDLTGSFDPPGSAGPTSTTLSKYDADDRLVTEAKTTSTQDTFTQYSYTRTVAGVGGGASSTIDGSDQTNKTVHDGNINGQVIEQTSYSYDVTGRMSGVTVVHTPIGGSSTTDSVTYRYDSNGFRVERTEGGVTTVYLIDPDNPTGYAQVLEEGIDANADHKADTVQKSYTLGMRVLTQATANGGSALVRHLLTDAHGSTRAVLDARLPATSPALRAPSQGGSKLRPSPAAVAFSASNTHPPRSAPPTPGSFRVVRTCAISWIDV
jgi:hypothetical protein